MTVYSWAWLGIFVAVVGFEVFTIVRKGEGDTLSEQVYLLRGWLKSKGRAGQFGWVAFVWTLLGFFGWLAFHFVVPGSA